MAKIDKRDLISAGLTMLGAAVTVANMIVGGKKEDRKIDEAVKKALEKQSK